MILRDRVWIKWSSKDLLYLASYLDGTERKLVEVFATTRDFEKTAHDLGRSSVSNIRANIKNAIARALNYCSVSVREVALGPSWPYDQLGLRRISEQRKNTNRQITLEISVAEADLIRAKEYLKKAVENLHKVRSRYRNP